MRPAPASGARGRRSRGTGRCATAWETAPPSSAGKYGADLARVYASADVFLFASRTDTFGQVVLEAQASGLPVVAVAEGGPTSLIDDGDTGLLVPADPQALANAVRQIVESPLRGGAPAPHGPAVGPRPHLGGGARAACRWLPTSARERPAGRTRSGLIRVLQTTTCRVVYQIGSRPLSSTEA